MTTPHSDPAAQSGGLLRRLLAGRRRYVFGAMVIAIWVLVAVVVGFATAGGVVWF
jgi:hypothetical protein